MAELWEMDWARLPLDSLVNVRELGGYPTESGRPTRYHRFLRSDGLDRLSDSDAEFLHRYGVRAVVDLRGDTEAGGMPDRRIADDVVSARFPLFEVNVASQEQMGRDPELDEVSLETVYGAIVGAKESMGECMRFIAGAPEGCILFHCAVGKDRTGVLAYLLMSIAGCDRWDCLSSYVVSRLNLMRLPGFPDFWDSEISEVRRGHMDSAAETLEIAIEMIEGEYGGVEGYLRACGVSDAEIAAIRARMLD